MNSEWELLYNNEVLAIFKIDNNSIRYGTSWSNWIMTPVTNKKGFLKLMCARVFWDRCTSMSFRNKKYNAMTKAMSAGGTSFSSLKEGVSESISMFGLHIPISPANSLESIIISSLSYPGKLTKPWKRPVELPNVE